MTCVTCQTVAVARSRPDGLEDLCRWYAARLDELMQVRTPNGDPELAAEVAQLRRDLATVNGRLAAANVENEALRKAAKR